MPAISRKYGVLADEECDEGSRASAIGVVPSGSANIAGRLRRSLSFGGGVAASGGRCMGPGMGGAVTAGDAPPAPTASALGSA
jgi:hypothetical protein